MRQAIAPVTCKCGTANHLTSSNTVIVYFVYAPEYEHLLFTCRSCFEHIRYWASRDELGLAARSSWRVQRFMHPDEQLVAARAALFPPRYRLTPRHEQGLSRFAAELELLTPDQVLDRMEEQHACATFPAVWVCNCGSPQCAPVTEAPAGAPLEII